MNTEAKQIWRGGPGAGGPWPPLPNSPKILVVAGEASGDDHAARLVAALKESLPQAEFFGVGGEALAAQGVRILFPAEELAVTGLVEVLGRLPAVWRALAAIARALKQERPNLAILVDYPDFNFWVARLARWRRVPVMYYISPQVWAWRTYRVRSIARLVTRMVVIFPFEAEFYRQRGVPVDYVGHPFRETLLVLPPRQALLKEWGLDPDKFTMALLPGSRASEIERHLPVMLAAAQLIQQAIPETQFLLPQASTAPAELVERMVQDFLRGGAGSAAPCPPPKPPTQPFKGLGEGVPGPLPHIHLLPGQAYAALAASHLAVVASGTATVEAALAGTPSIIVYRLSPLSYEVGRKLIRVDHIGMANLLAGERLFPELIQHEVTAARLAREVLSLVQEDGRVLAIRQGLGRLVNAMGGPGASQGAAQVALELLGAARRAR